MEKVGPDMLEDNVIDPGESSSFLDPGEGTSSRYDSRSHASQWRDRRSVFEAAHNDPDTVFATAESLVKDKNGVKSAKVVKRVFEDPHLGEPLYKYIKKLDEDYGNMGCQVFKYPKLDTFLAKNQHTQRKYLYLLSCQKMPKFDFQSHKPSESV